MHMGRMLYEIRVMQGAKELPEAKKQVKKLPEDRRKARKSSFLCLQGEPGLAKALTVDWPPEQQDNTFSLF